MRFFKQLIGAIARLMLAALAINLLYIYYEGNWRDPIKAVEYAEVVFLWLFVVGSLIWGTYYIISIKRELKEKKDALPRME
jgi:TRAP-type C4-dicarboxylate transport system permease small subunit